MRNIAVTFQIDGVPTKMNIRKVPHQRRFQVIIDKNITEYVISDQTNQLEYYEGPVLSGYLLEGSRT